jgi:hypothetical protein
MAIHTQLPIYKVSYDLLDASVDFVANMPRSFKSVIGSRVSQLCLDLVLLIYRANCARDKVPHIEQLLERTQELEMWFRVLLRTSASSPKAQYAKADRAHDRASASKRVDGRKHQCRIACHLTVTAVRSVRFSIWSRRWLLPPSSALAGAVSPLIERSISVGRHD